MEYIVLEPQSGLGVKYTSNIAMRDIAFFLMSDVGRSGGSIFCEWLHDEGMVTMEGNYFLLIKKGPETFINCKYNEDFYVDASKFTTLALVDLLEQWDMVCTLDPDEVMITYDQGKFHVEGKITQECKGVAQ